MGRLFRFVISGKSVAELKENMRTALEEFDEETTAAPAVTSRTATETLAIEKLQFTDPIPNIPAQATPAAPQAVAPAEGVDSMGFPWDARIHSSNLGKSKDGSWRARRGVEPAYVKQVEHELISRIKAGGAAEAPTFHNPPTGLTPPSPAAPVPPAAVPTLQQSAPVMPMGNVPPPVQSIAPVAVVVPHTVVPIVPSIVTPVAPPQPVAIPSAHTVETFRSHFISLMAQLVGEGKVTNDYLAALKTYFKLEQIHQANDEQKAQMFEAFAEAGLITKVG